MAAVPRHYCQRPANHTAATVNGSGAWLRATVPLDLLGAPRAMLALHAASVGPPGPQHIRPQGGTKGRKDDSV